MHIHLIAIGGTGMAPLACLLQAEGHRVTGSDGPLYPPMSTLLAAAGIVPFEGYAAAHLDPAPDLVVVGNAVPRTNPEAVALEALGLPRLSMPEALARFFLADRQPLVVAGTHGKTTTTALAAWVWTDCGQAPGYLVGGLPLGLPASFARGSGPRFLIEGDEYNAAYFDRGPKFLHYRPETVIFTSLELDHTDLYPDLASLRAAFAALLALVPASGRVVACADDPEVRALLPAAAARVVTYGLAPGADYPLAAPPEPGPEGLRLRLVDPEAGEVELRLPLWGEHNVRNALGVWAAARGDGISPAALAAAFARFPGVRRRQELVGEAAGIAVLDDFAHHPTAVGTTLAGLRTRFPGRRLWALYEPRSLSAGRAFQHAAYREAFRQADRILLAPVFHRQRLTAEELLDLPVLAAELSAAGHPCRACDSLEEIEATIASEARAGDVIVAMSSGSFGQLPLRLLASLREREEARL